MRQSTVLVVDDEKEIADFIELYLKNENYNVHKFYNGKDALACVEHENIDLAILDVMLPDIDKTDPFNTQFPCDHADSESIFYG